MRAEKTILFSDLDGTLFDPAGRVSAENREAIRRYIRQGGMFAISTGRQPQNALRHLPDVEINAPSVVLNGAAVYDFGTGEYAFVHYLDRKQTDPVLETARREIPGLDIQVYTDGGIFYETPREMAEPHLLDLHLPCSFVDPAALAGENVIKYLVYAPPAGEDRLRQLLTDGDGNGYRLVPGTTDVGGRLAYFELMPPGVSKGAALASLRSHPALEGRTFLAAGDYWNDWELLRAADVAVAPENAIEEIRAAARYVGPPNDRHLIAWILRELIPEL